jgi:CRP-like cAMP-binding protein
MPNAATQVRSGWIVPDFAFLCITDAWNSRHGVGGQRHSLPQAATIVPTHRLMRNAHLLCVQNRVSTLKTVSTMEVLIFQKEAFEEMAAKFSRFSDRVNELLAKQGGKSLNRWMDNQEVCRQLNISPRTLQTLRDNGTLAYSQINHKVFYRPEDVSRIVKPVERKLADKAV